MRQRSPRLPSGLSAESAWGQRWWLVAACATALGLASLAPIANLASDGRIAIMDLMSDPVEVTGISLYIGAVSDLNLFVWAAGAAIFLVAAFGLRSRSRRLSMALAWLGAFTVVFTMDDRFLLHEAVYPWLFGFTQTLTYVLYAAALMSILVWHRRVLLSQPEVALLVFALVALGASVLLDVVGWDSTVRRVAEETAKMLGAVAWSLFPAAIVVRHLSGAGTAAATDGEATASR